MHDECINHYLMTMGMQKQAQITTFYAHLHQLQFAGPTEGATDEGD